MGILKYLGIIIELIGAAILIFVGLRGNIQSNTLLVVGLIAVVGGFLFHIIANKYLVPMREK
ncbi:MULTISPECIES: hypothetical protein [Porphyromonas]|uniref:Uncharacterized protein n=1 Tax=Porphyromonas canoris TaxID=36875 RepID=A0ABR4XMJ3_9PORP|nr:MULTISPECIES: hypothetical protein [Porphyromonas]KGL51586.1 hypothetical protein HQ29_09010 [Porphyromonas canoris]KGN67316.1 hypothetical protein JT26_08685 [Porphyromonas sp. COT-108 OH1349]KGN93326.1 hypothetical protein HQ43_01385 [Porphyromonas canoris]KGN96537.1 hypothetical protein HQ39_00250 [Porphyromonas sp. COT-108 OH2963]